MSIYEYDAERHLRMEKEEAYKDGQAFLIRIIRKKRDNGKIITEIAADLDEDEQVIQELVKQLPK